MNYILTCDQPINPDGTCTSGFNSVPVNELVVEASMMTRENFEELSIEIIGLFVIAFGIKMIIRLLLDRNPKHA